MKKLSLLVLLPAAIAAIVFLLVRDDGREAETRSQPDVADDEQVPRERALLAPVDAPLGRRTDARVPEPAAAEGEAAAEATAAAPEDEPEGEPQPEGGFLVHVMRGESDERVPGAVVHRLGEGDVAMEELATMFSGGGVLEFVRKRRGTRTPSGRASRPTSRTPRAAPRWRSRSIPRRSSRTSRTADRRNARTPQGRGSNIARLVATPGYTWEAIVGPPPLSRGR